MPSKGQPLFWGPNPYLRLLAGFGFLQMGCLSEAAATTVSQWKPHSLSFFLGGGGGGRTRCFFLRAVFFRLGLVAWLGLVGWLAGRIPGITSGPSIGSDVVAVGSYLGMV